MDQPLTRTELQNLRATLEAKRLQDVTVQQFIIEIVSEVIAVAVSPERKRQYTRREWKCISMTKEIQEGICLGLRQRFPDTSVYFIPADTDARRTPLSISYSTHPMLIVDWS